jgi:hypothetical protein
MDSESEESMTEKNEAGADTQPTADQLDMSVEAMELAQRFDRIELGIDGNAAFALLGEDIQSGEVEFVQFEGESVNAELIAAKRALNKLRARLGRPELSYFFGRSHPYGN